MSLSMQGVAVGFARRRVLAEIDLNIDPGQCWAVLGNNGSGKTTLLHTLAGIRPALGGLVGLDGNPLDAMDSRARARALGLLLQEEPLEFWGSVLEYVRLGRFPHTGRRVGPAPEDERIAREQLEVVALASLSHRPLASLSGGERQRARLALTLTQQPLYYLLDEPLQHLDLRHQGRMLAHFAGLARTGDRAVVMALHDPLLARRYCDHALLVFEGGPALSGPAAAILTAANLERLYGVPVTL